MRVTFYFKDTITKPYRRLNTQRNTRSRDKSRRDITQTRITWLTYSQMFSEVIKIYQCLHQRRTKDTFH